MQLVDINHLLGTMNGYQHTLTTSQIVELPSFYDLVQPADFVLHPAEPHGPLLEVMAAQPKPMMAINKADQFRENFKRLKKRPG